MLFRELPRFMQPHFVKFWELQMLVTVTCKTFKFVGIIHVQASDFPVAA